MVLEGREGDGRRSGLFGVWIDDIRHICLFGRFLRARTCTRTKHNKANNKSEMVGSEKERKSEGKGMRKGGGGGGSGGNGGNMFAMLGEEED